MKFIIERISSCNNEEPPCAGCKRETLTELLWCNRKTLEETRIEAYWFWTEDKRNQREENGRTVCESTSDFWTIELDSPLDLFKREGRLIIQESECLEYPIKIRIYDSWAE